MAQSLTTPVPQSDRIQSIDVLRGFVLMGILVINIHGFSMPWSVVEGNPASYGDLTGINFFVWLISFLFFNEKMMNIFSMLFGAGLVIMTTRADQKNAKTFLLYYRRTFILLVVGMIHAYLISDVDILFVYAWCAFIAYWFRKWPAMWLIISGIIIFLIKFIFMTIEYHHILAMTPDQIQEWAYANWHQASYVNETVNVYRSDYWTILSYQIANVLDWQINTVLLGFYFVRPLGMILLGMGLYKLGVFSAILSNRFYRNLMLIGFFIGLTLSGYGAWRMVQSQWDAVIGEFIGYRLLYLSALFTSFGWIGFIMLVCKSGCCRGLMKHFAAAGQIALTNYLMQTFICVSIFYGYGLGWYGYVDRWALMLIVIPIWAFQLLISPVWLHYFRFGPFEWLWRTLTYCSIQPLRRNVPVVKRDDTVIPSNLPLAEP